MPTSTHVFNNDTHTVILSIDLPVTEYLPKVDKKLKEYRNKAQIKGFRTGEVPMSFLRAKFGNSILVEEVQELINQELNSFLETAQLNMVGSPLPVNKYDASIQKPKDVKLDIEIGFIPEFSVNGISSEAAMPFYAVEIDDETMEKEIEAQRKKLSQDFEEGVSDIQEGDTLRIVLREAKNGVVLEDGLVKEDTYIALDKVSASLKEQLLKAMVGEKLFVNLADTDTSSTLKRIKKAYFGLTPRQTCSDEAEIEILEIKRVRARELNTDFFKELFPYAEIEDYDAFRTKLRSAIAEGYTSAVYNIFNRAVYEHLVAQNKNLPLPSAFLRRFVEQTQLKGKKMEDKEFDSLIKQITWNTITQKLSEQLNIEVSQQDVEYEMRMAIVRYYGFQISPFHSLFNGQVQKMMQDRDTYRKYYEEVQEAKLFTALEGEFSKDNRTVAAKDFKEVYDKYFNNQQEKEDEEAEQLEKVFNEGE